jgi:hypothetical protein
MTLFGGFGLVNEILLESRTKKGKAYGKGDYEYTRLVEAYMVVFI